MILAKSPSESKLRATAVPVTITAAEGGATPPRFSIVGYTGGILDLGWPWDRPVVVDLATIDLTAQRIPALYDHCTYELHYLVGQTDSIKLVNGELQFSGIIAVRDTGDRTNYAQQIVDLAKAGVQMQASIGGNPSKVEEIPAGQSIEVNGRTFAGPVAVARGLTLREISFVVLGADRHTSAAVTARRSKKLKAGGKPGRIQGAAMTFEEWLAKMGWTTDEQSALDEVKKANLMEKFREEYPEDGGDTGSTETPTNAEDGTDEEEQVAAEGEAMVDDEEEVVPTNAAAAPVKIKGKAKKQTADEIRAAERKRVSTINSLCRDHGNPKVNAGGKKVRLADHAIEAGWNVDRVKAKLLEHTRTERPKGPTPMKANSGAMGLEALQGAMLLRCGGRLDAKAYQSAAAVGLLPAWLRASINDANRNRIMEAAHKFAGWSMVDVARESLRASGKQVPHDREEMIRAAFSNNSLANVYTTSINAQLLATYMEAPDTTQGWVRETDVSNYLLQERVGLTKGPALTRHPVSKEEADHMSRSDTVETYKIGRYSGQIKVDEIDVINDNLGAISDFPVEMGYAAARLRPDLVYAVILANANLNATGRALFNSTDGNLNTSVTPIDSDKIKAGIADMFLIRENGVNLGLMPTHIMVPPSIRHKTSELINSSTVLKSRAGTTDTTVEFGSENSLRAENLTLVSDPRLENGVIDPSTGTTYSGNSSYWYLACALARTIEVGYLAGSGRAPRIRSWTDDKEGKYGMGWDVSHSIGAAALDWKGLQKNT